MPPENAGTDADDDGVDDGLDECPTTPAGELVDDTGCSVCPCDGSRDGHTWTSRNAYLRCVRGESRRSFTGERLTRGEARDAVKRALVSTCARKTVTRCCVVRDGGARLLCRIMEATACETQRARGAAVDVGHGSCLPSPCAP